jgi:phenylacetate-CoA ligase
MSRSLGPLETLALMPRLLRHPAAQRADIQAFQNQQLRCVVEWAYRNVPYYRRLMDGAGVKPAHIRKVADLPAIPISSRSDLQDAPLSEIVAEGVDPTRLVAYTTSGSTGEPHTIRRGWWEERLLNVLRRRAQQLYGRRWQDKMAIVASSRPQGSGFAGALQRGLGALGINRAEYFSVFDPVDELLRRLRRADLDLLHGYPGALARIGERMASDDREAIHPRFILSGGEMLTPGLRARIASGFAAPVFDLYGCFEFNLVAWECPATGELHVCDDGLVLEVLRPDGSPAREGEWGEVVGTALHSFAMPLIRYRLGDLAVQGAPVCSCGQPFATIREILGRTMDYFVMPSGRRIHPFELVPILTEGVGWVKQQQLIQERRDLIVLRVVADTPPTAEQIHALKAAVSAALEPGVELQVVPLSEIAPEPSGKYRHYYSHVVAGRSVC